MLGARTGSSNREDTIQQSVGGANPGGFVVKRVVSKEVTLNRQSNQHRNNYLSVNEKQDEDEDQLFQGRRVLVLDGNNALSRQMQR